MIKQGCKEMGQSTFMILIQLLAFAVVVYVQYKIPYLKRGKKKKEHLSKELCLEFQESF